MLCTSSQVRGSRFANSIIHLRKDNGYTVASYDHIYDKSMDFVSSAGFGFLSCIQVPVALLQVGLMCLVPEACFVCCTL